jgi:hypothetical protein
MAAQQVRILAEAEIVVDPGMEAGSPSRVEAVGFFSPNHLELTLNRKLAMGLRLSIRNRMRTAVLVENSSYSTTQFAESLQQRARYTPAYPARTMRTVVYLEAAVTVH